MGTSNMTYIKGQNKCITNIKSRYGANNSLTKRSLSGIVFSVMSQDKLIKMVSVGDDKGVGKGHTYYTRKNKRKLAEKKFEFKKFNPIAKKHTIYKEK